MSDFATSTQTALTSTTSAASAATTDFSPTANHLSTDCARTIIEGVADGETKVDLREVLNVVIEEENEFAELSEEEVSAIEQRRVDLVMWLLNLERRLTPYTADFA